MQFMGWMGERKTEAGLESRTDQGRMKLERGYTISHEMIYRYIYANKHNGGRLYKHLRHKNKKYHKRGYTYDNRGILKNRTMIDKRPKIVEKKRRIGDWKIDTVIEFWSPLWIEAANSL